MTPTALLRRLLLTAAIAACAPLAHAATPKGSITIERIADIKYPTNPAWSPDGTRVAFLWDAAGKQDLFVVTPGQAPKATPRRSSSTPRCCSPTSAPSRGSRTTRSCSAATDACGRSARRPANPRP